MISIDPSQLSAKENYKFLIGSIIPRPIAFVTSQSPSGTVNGAPFSFFNIVSADPPMVSIAVQRKAGEQKDTARNIAQTKEFVVHIVDEGNVSKINETAASLKPDESEVELAGLTPTKSEVVGVPGVEEAKVRMECVLEQIVTAGGGDLVIGRIVKFHIREDLYANGRIDKEKLQAVSRLAGNDYAKIGETFTIKRPD
ncbi:hypothetical protein AF331_16710 [Rossellomorea marisflavi]|uniref:Flavin reductase like domain-containing protein n=1 Tax=Rossellomorea marisflavi TaxID=189381 RepID=A0A0M0G2V2_9BACI|nr:flavin reductase family protein [Rossellomorea marisflavi]KON83801.1 hypothetical protein AF331_16710 [Rossellomorea marisflavi]